MSKRISNGSEILTKKSKDLESHTETDNSEYQSDQDGIHDTTADSNDSFHDDKETGLFEDCGDLGDLIP
jgi:hypothetical protein